MIETSSDASPAPTSAGPRPLRRDWRFIRRTLIVAVVAVGTVLLLAGLWYGKHALMLVFAAVLIAIALRGASDSLAHRTALTPQMAFGMVIVSVLVLAGAGGWLLAPRLGGQLAEMTEELPRAYEALKQRARKTTWGQRVFDGTEDDTAREAGKAGLPQVFGRVFRAVGSTLGMVGDLVVLLFLSFFLALDAGRYREGLLRFIPPRWRERTDDYLKESKKNLHRWLLGRLVDMAFVGTFTYLGLWFLNVPLALSLALITALMGFIPFFGPILATIPATLMGLSVSPATAVWVVLLYLVVQITEGNVITPMIEQRAVSIPPAVTLSVVLLLGLWAGPLGMALAVPLTILVWLAVKHLYLEDVLGERPAPSGD